MTNWERAVTVGDLAHTRSGDKGDCVNIGVVATDEAAFERLDEQLTAERVSEHFEGIVEGDVTRYRLENIQAFNFVGTRALDGGGQVSLRYDTQGKTYGALMLGLELPGSTQAETN